MLRYLGTQEQRGEKKDKYQDLRIELRKLSSIIIRALGTIPKSLKRNLEESGADVAPGLLQRSVVLETAHITRGALSRVQVSPSWQRGSQIRVCALQMNSKL